MRYMARKKSSNPDIASEIQAVADKQKLRLDEIPKDLINALEQSRKEEKDAPRRG